MNETQVFDYARTWIAKNRPDFTHPHGVGIALNNATDAILDELGPLDEVRSLIVRCVVAEAAAGVALPAL